MVQTMLNSSLHTLELQAERKLLAELSRAKDLERSHIKGVYFSKPVTGIRGSAFAITHSRKTLVPRSSSLARDSAEMPTPRASTPMSEVDLPKVASPRGSGHERAPLPEVWSTRKIEAARVEGLPGSRAYHDVLRQTAVRTPPAQMVMHDNHPSHAAQAAARDRARLQDLEHRRHGTGIYSSASLPSLGDMPRVPSYRPVAPWAKWRGGFDD